MSLRKFYKPLEAFLHSLLRANATNCFLPFILQYGPICEPLAPHSYILKLLYNSYLDIQAIKISEVRNTLWRAY